MSLFHLVDDDPDVLGLLEALLQERGHEVVTHSDGAEALPLIIDAKPDGVVIDLMMPGMDGFELCRLLREDPNLDNTKIVMISGKSYEFDRRRALGFGADGFVGKPLDVGTFVEKLERILADRVTATFWGVRGTLPVPGPKSLRYGGNTSCVSLEFTRGQFFVFDAGTGIKALSDHLMATRHGHIEAKIFVSHPHWDHINALPFFAPLFVPGNEFEIIGARHGDISMREMISAQMDGVYFPITLKEFGARVYFRDVDEATFEIDDIRVRTKLLSHPGKCLGYRVDYKGRSFAYVTDNELYLEDSPHHNAYYRKNLVAFIEGADVVVTDTTYRDVEYPSKVGWGHSAVGEVVKLAHDAKVGRLCLFHHDPDQSDDAIDVKLQDAREMLDDLGSETEVLAPAEGDVVEI